MGCTTDFSGAVNDPQGSVCPNELPTEGYDVGDNIEAGNGVTVEVADKFKTTDLPVACFNFYLGEQKLNDSTVCVQNLESTFDSECWSDQFADYGVKIVYYFSDINDLRLNVLSTTSGNVNTPLDLFSECINANKYDDICTRYISDEKMDDESELVSGANHVFFSKDLPDLGAYHSEQLDACVKLAKKVLLDDQEAPTNGYSLRSIVRFGEKIMIEALGRAIGSHYQINYFKDKEEIDDFFETTSEYTDIDDGMCYDGVTLHELSHNFWGSVLDSYFPLNLQEGAARFLELTYTANPEPKIYLDSTLHEGDTFVLEHESLENGKITYRLETISPDELQFAILDDWGEVFVWSYFKPGVLDKLTFASDFQLVLDKPKNDDNGHSVRLRIVRNQPLVRPANFKLECDKNSYNLSNGLWLGGMFYPSENVTAEGNGNNLPHVSLSSPPIYASPEHYSTGACFFKGIEEIYNAAGADFSTFFPKLTASIYEYQELPLKDQFENEYCILDEMQKIVNGLGGQFFDIEEYAKKFGYSNGNPWCTSLPVNKGDVNDFGDLF